MRTAAIEHRFLCYDCHNKKLPCHDLQLIDLIDTQSDAVTTHFTAGDLNYDAVLGRIDQPNFR